ncbi:hypothetical protein [Rhizobium leguminosarum]|uniref:hypothetical protein n=1 Tax=Rhizobium leguminosarum TaxID=384 RepID=UPI001AE4F34D|nr:hypothetical protein [Rhizobium leguminosarum]MBP2444839.1 vacuolar-type H+-ATPase subunit I/STV1 [Rhizobium leguminosarum]
MAKAATPSEDPRTQLAELEKFVAAEKERLSSAVQAAEDADRAKSEADEAEKLAALRSEASVAAEYLLDLAKRIDTKAAELVKLLLERRDAGNEFARQYDRRVVWIGNQHAHMGLIDSCLVNAGLHHLTHIRSRGGLSLEYTTRQMLAPVLKAGI